MQRLDDTDLTRRLVQRLAETLVEAVPDRGRDASSWRERVSVSRDRLDGAPALAVGIDRTTWSVPWDGSDRAAEELVESAAWGYAAEVEDDSL